MSITDEIATWVAESEMNLTSEALRLARNAMIDIVGCMIAGAND